MIPSDITEDEAYFIGQELANYPPPYMETDKQHLSAEAFNKLASMGTEKKLSKHLQAAVNHLEKQYDKYGDKLGDLQRKVEDISDQMEVLNDLRSDLYEQIKKLKGE